MNGDVLAGLNFQSQTSVLFPTIKEFPRRVLLIVKYVSSKYKVIFYHFFIYYFVFLFTVLDTDLTFSRRVTRY